VGHKLLKFYSLIAVVFFAFLTTKTINCFLVLPIIIDLTLDLFNIKKNQKINKGLKIYSLTLVSFYMVRWIALMIDYLIFGEESEYFIFGVGFFALFFATPVVYLFFKNVFGEKTCVKNIFYIVMTIYFLFFVYGILDEIVNE
jgi:hypothetical protein